MNNDEPVFDRIALRKMVDDTRKIATDVSTSGLSDEKAREVKAACLSMSDLGENLLRTAAGMLRNPPDFSRWSGEKLNGFIAQTKQLQGQLQPHRDALRDLLPDLPVPEVAGLVDVLAGALDSVNSVLGSHLQKAQAHQASGAR